MYSGLQEVRIPFLITRITQIKFVLFVGTSNPKSLMQKKTGQSYCITNCNSNFNKDSFLTQDPKNSPIKHHYNNRI